ncbi:MAG TPA: hemerythrin domain-containing protein [Acidimicrobiia bacterium]|nr:hemerythrin domain-containing protein [Acidimicrobiia bacterium]
MTTQTTTTGARVDAIELLSTDHREVEQFFRQYEAASNDDGVAHHAAEQIIRELSVHAAVEEMILYPLIRKFDPAQSGLVDHSLEEHQEVKELLARIDGRPANDPETRQTMGKLKSAVEEHVSEEEGKLFPALRNQVKADELMQLGEKMAKAKAMAPTHPHPNAPNTPPGNIVAGPLAAIADKVRDFLRQ